VAIAVGEARARIKSGLATVKKEKPPGQDVPGSDYTQPSPKKQCDLSCVNEESDAQK
jgi:hypothetical protein